MECSFRCERVNATIVHERAGAGAATALGETGTLNCNKILKPRFCLCKTSHDFLFIYLFSSLGLSVPNG